MLKVLTWLNERRKFLVALVGFVFVGLSYFFADTDWYVALIPLLTALGVERTKNHQPE